MSHQSIYLIFFLLLSFAFAKDPSSPEKEKTSKFKVKEPKITEDLKRGSYLIYDCKNSHFACVNLEGHEKCKKKRKESFKRRKSFLGCTPFKKFKSQKDCFNYQYIVQYQNPPKVFCLNTSRKNKL